MFGRRLKNIEEILRVVHSYLPERGSALDLGTGQGPGAIKLTQLGL